MPNIRNSIFNLKVIDSSLLSFHLCHYIDVLQRVTTAEPRKKEQAAPPGVHLKNKDPKQRAFPQEKKAYNDYVNNIMLG